MRIVNPHWGTAAATAALALFALTGCQSTPTPVLIPTATADAPVFASDEEALAAATEAYAAYLKVSDSISNEGGAMPNRIEPFVSAELLQSELDGFAEFQKAGARTIGATSFRVTKLQTASYTSSADIAVAIYLCEDVSAVEVIDSAGNSIVSPNRKPITPFEVRLTMNTHSSFVLDERAVWKGENFC